MQLLFLSQWFTDDVLKALCWTLVHSLWQGLLAAALAGIIIIGTKRSSARLRYNMLGILLTLFLFTVGVTLYQQGGSMNEGTPISNRIAADGNDVFTGLVEHQDQRIVSSTGSVDIFIGFLNRNTGLIMLVWAIFFLGNCIKIIAGLSGIRRLRTCRTHAADEWQAKLNYLSKTIGIHPAVRLLQSELIRVPVAIGFFKPVILVPLGLLSHLPPDQVETILLHELAHIRRRDYLMNILQRFTEAIFFFNPALLWISSLIRQEREACCDDIVVANTHHKGSYLEALVSFQEYSVTGPAYAMGISSKKNYLLNRVKRMLTRENKKLDLMEKILLIVGVTVVSAFTFMPKKEVVAQQEPVRQSVRRTEEKPPVNTTPANTSATVTNPVPIRSSVHTKETTKPVLPTAVIKDTVPPQVREKESTMTTDEELSIQSISSSTSNDGKTKKTNITVVEKNGKTYTISRLNDKITSFSIDGTFVPENEMDKYSSLLDKIDRAVQKNKEEREKDREVRKEEAMRRKEEMIERSAERKENMEEHRKREKIAEHERIEMKKRVDREKTVREMDNKHRQTENEKRKKDIENHRKHVENEQAEIKQKMEAGRKEREMENMQRKMENERRRTEMERDRKQAEKERTERAKAIRNNDNGKVLLNGREVVIHKEKNENVQKFVRQEVSKKIEKATEQKKDMNMLLQKGGLELRADTKLMVSELVLVNSNPSVKMSKAAEIKKVTLVKSVQLKNDMKLSLDKCADPAQPGNTLKKVQPDKPVRPTELHKTPSAPKKPATFYSGQVTIT